MDQRFRAPPLPSAFIWRRAHSFTGLWLVLFLIEHLLTNSQAALLLGEDGQGFVDAVNWIQGLPYLPFIEIGLLAVPFAIHAFWGVRYLWTAKFNVLPSDGSTPSLPEYKENKAYTWQRITSWILLFGIMAHVIQMRFLEYPSSGQMGQEKHYMVKVSSDPGLYPLAERLGFVFYTPTALKTKIESLQSLPFNAHPLVAAQEKSQRENYVLAMQQRPLEKEEVLIVADSFGMAELLMVRDVFKSPLMIFLYAGLVLAACFHAFNGLWTFLISWGITLTVRSQQAMRTCAVGLMVLIAFLGLAAIIGTYWINLRI